MIENPDFWDLKSLQPDVVDLWFSKYDLCLGQIVRVWNIKGLKPWGCKDVGIRKRGFGLL